jgi:hypothetical protein
MFYRPAAGRTEHTLTVRPQGVQDIGEADCWKVREVRQAVAQVVGYPRRCGQAQEGSMNQNYIRRGVFVSLLGGMFIVGFVSGSVSQRSAQAQVPGVGKGVLEHAPGAGGALGSVTELGSSIVEMQQHVDGLQKNLATLKKVQAALGGGK